MHLNCPECEFPIHYNDINITKTIAKCKECNNLFTFTEELANTEVPMIYPREEIMIPNGIEMLKLMGELEISISWRKSAKHYTLLFALIWNVFIGFFFMMMLFSGGIGSIIFLAPFLFVGAYLLYASVGQLINTTYITVDEERISVEHKPINFLVQRDQHFLAEDIKQLFVRRYKTGESNGNPVYAFSVNIKLRNGRTFPLVKELHSANYGKYIEQEIEKFLKIKNVPVQGEWE